LAPGRTVSPRFRDDREHCKLGSSLTAC
jgi:hypothetical protein